MSRLVYEGVRPNMEMGRRSRPGIAVPGGAWDRRTNGRAARRGKAAWVGCIGGWLRSRNHPTAELWGTRPGGHGGMDWLYWGWFRSRFRRIAGAPQAQEALVKEGAIRRGV